MIKLMQQCQEMNLAKMTRTYEIILQKRKLSCKGIARDLRIYGGFIVDLMIFSSLFFAVFLFWFMFSAIVKVFRYFRDRNILWAKSPPISGITGDLLRRIFGKFCVFPVIHLSENWIANKKEIFSSIFPEHEVLRFLLNRPQAESRLSNLWNLSFIHSWWYW